MKNFCLAVVFFIVISSFCLVSQAGEITQLPVMAPAFRKEEVSHVVVEVVEKENIFMVLLTVFSTLITSFVGLIQIKVHFFGEAKDKVKTGRKNKKQNRNTKPGGVATRFSLLPNPILF